MAVIIDTFEVISDAASTTASAGGNDSAQSSASNNMKPGDIEAVLEHQYLRSDRLRAH